MTKDIYSEDFIKIYRKKRNALFCFCIMDIALFVMYGSLAQMIADEEQIVSV